MVQVSRDLDCQYKTAFVLSHKIRESMASGRPSEPLEGDVEVDGMYNGGYVRPANARKIALTVACLRTARASAASLWHSVNARAAPAIC